MMNYSLKDQTDDWYLHIILEVYALSLDVPLRIYKPYEICKIWEYAQFPDPSDFNNKISELFNDSIDNESLVDIYHAFEDESLKDVRRQLRADRGDHWYTFQANINRMLQLCSDYKSWRRWEFCSLYHQFVTQQPVKSDQVVMIPWGFDNHLHLGYLWIEEIQSFMVLGPVWQPTDRKNGEGFEKECVEPFVNKYIQMVSAAEPSNKEDVMNKKELLIQAGNSESMISAANIKHYLGYLARSLRSVLNTTHPQELKLYRSDYIKLAEWSLFIGKTVNMMKGYYQCPNRDTHFYYKVENFDGDGAKFWVETQLNCANNGSLSQFNLCQVLPANATSVSGSEDRFARLPQSITPSFSEPKQESPKKNNLKVFFEWFCKIVTQNNEIPIVQKIVPQKGNSPLTNDDSELLLARLYTSFSIFLHDIETKRYVRRARYISSLRQWLSDHFGVLTGIFYDKRFDDPQKTENQLAARIMEFLQADIATIYRYDYGDEWLETLGLYSGEKQRSQWFQLVPDYTKQAGKKTTERQHSICYRAIDCREIKFCRVFNPKTEVATPSNEWLLLPPKNSSLESHQSGIAAPIAVYGRSWGVLEILGTRPHQFRWDDRHFANELSHRLATFFYHQWFLRKLHELNKIAVDKKATDIGYNDICHCLAEMLLSHGTALWVLNAQDRYYTCAGTYNRNWGVLKEEKITFEDKSAVINFTRQAMQDESWQGWWEGTIGEEPLGSAWKNEKRNQGIAEQGIRHLCCIPVYSQQPNNLHNDNIVLAFIVLYNKIDSKYDTRWKHLFRLVSRYAAVVFEAMQEQDEQERRSRSSIQHELKAQIDRISDRVTYLSESNNNLLSLLDTLPETQHYASRHYHASQREVLSANSLDILEWYIDKYKHLTAELSKSENEFKKHKLIIKDMEVQVKRASGVIDLLRQDKFSEYLGASSPIMASAQARRDNEPVQWLNMRQQFNEVFRTSWTKWKKKRLSLEYVASSEISILFHEQNLSHVLENLCDNAVKYSSENTIITASAELTPYSMNLTISNMGQCLGEGEEYSIFEDSYRGANSTGQLGEGMGLFIVRGICELYGVELIYRGVPKQEGICEHNFILSFPLDLVKTGE